MNRTTRKFIACLCIFQIAWMGVPLTAGAAMIGTDSAIESVDRDASLDRVGQFMAREEVRQQLLDWGVNPAEVDERLASLSDAELQYLADHMEDAPAGGVLAVIGIIFVVLLVLELVGVTNVFTNVGPAR